MKIEFRQQALSWISNARENGCQIRNVDAEVLQRTIEDFGLFLDEKIGSRKRERIFAQITTPDSISPTINSYINKRFGALYFDFYDWSEQRSPQGDKWMTYETEHFIIRYHQHSAADKDLKLIELTAEQAFNDISNILKPNEDAVLHLKSILRTDVEPSVNSNGKILINLYPSRSSLKAFEKISMGQTRFLPLWREEKVAYAVWIDLAYPGPVALFGIPHELAHALALVYLTDEPELARMLSSGKYMPRDSIQTALLSSDILRLEGWAYMVQYNYSTYINLDLWRSSREIIFQMHKIYGFPDIEQMLQGKINLDLKEKLLKAIGFSKIYNKTVKIRFLYASSDLIRFLYETYGANKLKLFLSDERPVVKALQDIYNITPEKLEKIWKSDVLEGSR